VSDVVIRRGDKLDLPFLRSLLAFAYGWHVAAFDTFDISIYHYVDAWGRPGDAALIAAEGGHPVGAAWYRLFPASRPGFGFVDDQTPEMTAVVISARQGQGIGTRLVAALLERAKEEGYPALSVSVQRGHPDEQLLREQGFAQVSEAGDTLTLRRAL
jgi:GNAT superfamily N-acetyltransferase